MSGNPWTISINYGPDGEQNYANVFDGDEWLVGNLRIHHANAVVTAVNSYASSQAEIERLRAENATLRAVATKIDADWTEAFPEGPEGDRTYLGGFGTLSDDTVEVWRVIRAALSGSKE